MNCLSSQSDRLAVIPDPKDYRWCGYAGVEQRDQVTIIEKWIDADDLEAMARKLRVVVAGGGYHVMNRGSRQEAIFRTDTDRRRFFGRLAEWPERFRTELHAFVLMDHHSHLVVRSQDANLSEAIGWLQMSSSSTFNGAHRIRGHLFQGRFHSVATSSNPVVLQASAAEVPKLLAPASSMDREVAVARMPPAQKAASVER